MNIRATANRKISTQILLNSSLGLQLLITAYLEYQIHSTDIVKGTGWSTYNLWIVLLLSMLLLTWANLVLIVKYVRQILRHELQPGILWVAPLMLVILIIMTMYLSNINFAI
jgi:hypothetical protein